MKNKRKFIDKTTEIKIIELYESGLTLDQVGEIVGWCAGACYQVLKRNGKNCRNRGEYPSSVQKYTYDQNFFEVIDTEEKAYWLGFIAADGNVNKPLTRLTIKLKIGDKPHLMKFLQSIKSDCPIKELTQFIFNKNFGLCLIEINNSKIVSDLNKLGIVPAKSKILRESPVKDELKRHYYRGLVDGDGSLVKYKHGLNNWNLVLCGSQHIVDSFGKFVFDNTGILQPSTACNGLPRIQFSCKKGLDVADLIYKDSTIYLDRKFELYKQMCL
jgi:hypothetical protein